MPGLMEFLPRLLLSSDKGYWKLRQKDPYWRVRLVDDDGRLQVLDFRGMSRGQIRTLLQRAFCLFLFRGAPIADKGDVATCSLASACRSYGGSGGWAGLFEGDSGVREQGSNHR
jgi:hypothetical protein